MSSTDPITWLTFFTAMASAISAFFSAYVSFGNRYTGNVMASFNTLTTEAARRDRAVLVEAAARKRLWAPQRRAAESAVRRQVERVAQLSVVVEDIKGNGWATAHAQVLYVETTKVLRELAEVRSKHGIKAPAADVRRANDALKKLPAAKTGWGKTRAKAPTGRL
ncbi:hypothetical protein ITJ50_03480 [Curtobacterium sp. VKM Ac-2889]|uniref:hypothetical protein n=1 Tax=unclassified Curtobacterium TaxID=257496 RepID=UPI00188A522B|nr:MULTISPECIES: hypothetical protein [unclassified Curtobacterium]MBF4598178.1 hypothetical protein [Curtobacterium sp. VKM Ac-1796]MBF4610273.1 hypothetical protein [Curtobacterium sp. VKM Ac-2889]